MTPAPKTNWNNVYTNMFTPRPYQIELLECALKRNTIVCLDNNSGKRFIALLLVRELVVKNALEDCGPKLAVILLNSEILIQDYYQLLWDHLDIQVLSVTNDADLNRNSAQICNKNQGKVIIMSPDHFLALTKIEKDFANIVDILVFDECQHVLSHKHSYLEILQLTNKRDIQPRILGLTSSILHENITSTELQHNIKTMEKILNCKAETATDLIALDRHSQSIPNEKIILSSDHHFDEEVSHFSEAIRSVLYGALEWMETCQIEALSKLTTVDWQIAENSVLENNHEPKTEEKGDICITADSALHNGDSNNHRSMEFSQDLNRSGGNIDHNFPKTAQTEKSSDGNLPDICFLPKLIINEFLLVMDVLGMWCVHKLAFLTLKQLHKSLLSLDRQLKSASKLLNKGEDLISGEIFWQKVVYQYLQTKLKMVYMICHLKFGQEKIVDLRYVSSKVHRLLQVLKEYKPISESEQKQLPKYNNRSEADYVSWWQDSDVEDEDQKEEVKEEGSFSPFANTLCGIVFVQEKCISMMLNKLLVEICKDNVDMKHVNSSFLTSPKSLVGKNYFDISSMDKSRQEEVLRKFRSHESNLLLCTGSLVECAYMPKCNLVVRFDAPRSYREYAQTKSRARLQMSAYIMLVRESEKHEFLEKLQKYKKIEQVLQGPNWTEQVSNFEESETDDNYDIIIPPYSPKQNVKASAHNAIKVINRYCTRLPSDPFTHLSPRCEVRERNHGDGVMHECTLQLPINSHLRELIKGPPMPNPVLAQRAVAVETCKRLHRAGELDANLMPIGKETVKYAEELDPWKREDSTTTGRPGSTKRRQTYLKNTPTALSSCLPFPDTSLFVYEIKMTINNPMPKALNVRQRKLYFPEETSRCFGILTTEVLPDIPGFPIFTRSGEEFAKLRLSQSYISLSAAHIKLVLSFHRYVFSDLLRLDRVPLTFSPEASTSQVLVVALNKICSRDEDLSLDWSFMMSTDAKRRTLEKVRRDPWYQHRMKERNKEYVFRRNRYEDGVVVAKYRSCDQPNRFYVAEIKSDLSPISPFPSNDYQSFYHYYNAKYGLDIKCKDQPLLDVDHTSSRLNLLTPRHLNQKGKALPMSSLEKQRAKYESLHNRQILVPELCEVHPIPACLWRKAVCLPSILYRVEQLIVAEELREDIALKSGICKISPPCGHCWQDLSFGWIPKSNKNNEYESIENNEDENIENNENQSLENIKNENMENNENQSMEYNEDENIENIKNQNMENIENQSIENNENQNMGNNENESIENIENLSMENIENQIIENKENQSMESKDNLIPDKNLGHSKDVIDIKNARSSDILSSANGEKYNNIGNMGNLRTDDNKSLNSINGNAHGEKLNTADKINNETVNTVSNLEISNGEATEKMLQNNLEDDQQSDVNKKLINHNEQFINKTENTASKTMDYSSDYSSSDDSKFSFCSDDFQNYFTLSDSEKETKKKTKRKRKKRQKSVSMIRRFIPKSVYDSALNGIQFDKCQIGPGPDLLLQALTLSNASDGFNLERLEMLGDSFLKHAVTVYLYCTYHDAHEGKLSYMRSKKVSNYNLYRIGRQFNLSGKMTSLIFDPTVNWMPTGFVVGTGEDLEEENSSDDDIEIGVWTGVPAKPKPKEAAPEAATEPNPPPNEEEIYEEEEIRMIDGMLGGCIHGLGDVASLAPGSMHFTDKAALLRSTVATQQRSDDFVIDTWAPVDSTGKPLNSNDPLMLDLHTQHSLADKSIADCVEAILGSYLTSCGQRAAQLLLCHIGLLVLPKIPQPISKQTVDQFGTLTAPPNSTLNVDNMVQPKLNQLLSGLAGFEQRIDYSFKNKSYLLQAFTHASYYYNTVTDCYQRLEFLGDAVLDFLITRHLFNDKRKHSPGALTDLRSALVNNTIFASLAVRYNFHKYFKSISPELQQIIEEFVSYQHKQEDAQGMDAQLMRHYGEPGEGNSQVVAPHFLDGEDAAEEDCEMEDIEVPKALGDIFESVAGAIYMDSGMDLEVVWKVYSPMMEPLIEKFSACVPRSPVRELLELEPETAKFSCAEKRYDGKVRVTVEIVGKRSFKGVGRSYRIAKSAAARRALRYLKLC